MLDVVNRHEVSWTIYTIKLTYDTPPPPLAVDVSFFNFKVSSDQSTGSFHLVSGGTGCDDYTTDLSGVVAVPDTGGWQEYINMAV